MSDEKITRYTFRLADPDHVRLSVGSNPRIVVGPEGFQTTDEKVANRLKRQTELEWTTDEIAAPQRAAAVDNENGEEKPADDEEVDA